VKVSVVENAIYNLPVSHFSHAFASLFWTHYSTFNTMDLLYWRAVNVSRGNQWHIWKTNFH